MGLSRWLPISALLLGPGCRQILGLDDLACAPAFSTATNYPTGANPQDVAVADLDRDGNLDVVTMNTGNATFSRLFGNGDGTLDEKADHEAGAAPTAFDVGDVNEDGYVDLFVVSASSNTLIVFAGNEGGLSGAGTYALSSPRDVAVADLDGDGDDDVVVAQPNNASTFLANPDGTLAAPVTVGAPANANRIALVDVTGDGILDQAIAALGTNQTLMVHIGNGDGTFQPRLDSMMPDAYSVMFGDVTSDGIVDMLVGTVTLSDASMTVRPGDNSGVFMAGTPVVTGFAIPMELADLNLDGILDLILINLARDATQVTELGVALGIGDGTFGEMTTTTTTARPEQPLVARLSGNTVPDLVTTLNVDNVAVVPGSCAQ